MDDLTHLVNRQGMAAAIEATTNGVVIADALLPDMPLVYVNAAFEDLTGYSSADIIGRNCRFLQGPETSPEAVAAVHGAIHDGRPIKLRLLNYRKDGSTFWNELTINPIKNDSGGIAGFVGIQHDVTAEVLMRRELDEKIGILEATRASLHVANTELQRIAYRDSLTGLPTRRLFFDRLSQSLARSKRSGDMLAVVFIDLDRFKQINDSYGHAAGDMVLRQAAERMRTQIRETDTLARLGGDEYVLLVDTEVSQTVVSEICDRLAGSFAQPFDLDGTVVQLSVSIGRAMYPQDGQDATSLMRCADIAMYGAKHDNRSADAPRRQRSSRRLPRLSGGKTAG